MAKIQIYACGGTGINIAAPFSNAEKKAGSADITVTYCDTSLSNISHIKPSKDSVFLIDGKDGSGGIRKSNSSEISDSINSLLITHPPGDLNILLGSGTGGTGSVYISYLSSAMLAAKIPFIVIVVNNTESKVSISNARDTMKSLAGVADKRKGVIVGSFYSNRGPLDAVVDENVRSFIRALALLYSGDHAGLDSKDLYHWVMPHITLGAQQGVAWLRIITGEDIAAKSEHIKDPVSIATLYRSANETEPYPHTPEYSTMGINSIENFPNDLYYVISYESVNELATTITDTQSKISAASKARSKLNTILSSEDELDEDGVFI